MGAKENGEERDDHMIDMEREAKQVKDAESDYEPARDSLSSQSEAQSNDDSKGRRSSRIPKKVVKKETRDSVSRASRTSTNRQMQSQFQYKASVSSLNKSPRPNKTVSSAKAFDPKKSEVAITPSRSSSEMSEEIDEKAAEEVKEIDVLDEAPNCDHSAGTDDEAADLDGRTVDEERASASERLEEIEQRVGKLEQELREVAALEISIYSTMPEHGSSSHKVHTPARRLARFYIYACKHWSPEKRASVAKNTVSGLLLISRSCSNDVSRLTYWLSNTVVLREIVSQTFETPLPRSFDGRTPVHRTGNSNSRQVKVDFLQITDDWQDYGNFVTALVKIEGWMFSRLVESVWWQALTPHMQTPLGESSTPRTIARLLGPSLGDHQQGDFSINLWKCAFQEAFNRLCPLRSGGHECGCLPVLAKTVMEQCISRLDVAMFNAILRESAHEMPTDPVSDPINDPKVLPIPAGELTFGSGAQLKNSIGNWSRWLTDKFGMDDDDSENVIGDSAVTGKSETKSFRLLNELSDLLMLPKDMLLDRSIRKEVCPSIDPSLVTRILCNFTPDEFCPDPVPSIVLEELNSESVLERSTKKEATGFPVPAAPIVYNPPSASDVAEKVSDAGGKAELDRRASMVQRRGYTSDDDLDDLDSALSSLIRNGVPASPSNAHTSTARRVPSIANTRYELLREVWSDRG